MCLKWMKLSRHFGRDEKNPASKDGKLRFISYIESDACTTDVLPSMALVADIHDRNDGVLAKMRIAGSPAMVLQCIGQNKFDFLP